MQKPALPKGTRDFAPEVMARRNFILDHIRDTFEKFGFQALETPAVERLDVLTGKYGEEGDQLIFKILDSGDYLAGLSPSDFQDYKKLSPKIAEKALRYDLTVPFARFVTMHRSGLAFPFKRYQIQPVWRGDRPQKGRYREFYQCDADVVGTDSLLCEAEIILMINEVLDKLGLRNFTLKINNRKILSGLAEFVGHPDQVGPMCVAIDKLDKIGPEKVLEELAERGFGESACEKIRPLLALDGTYESKMAFLDEIFTHSETGRQGQAEIRQMLALGQAYTQARDFIQDYHLDFDLTLARGLTYYTGAIFEVKALGVSIGSISGGGRYDNLTGAFGMPGVSGVGFSFGVDRLYDVMEELQLFPAETALSTQVLFSNFGEAEQAFSLPLVRQFRQAGINTEIYPEAAKLKKQMQYAHQKNIPFVVLVGETELAQEKLMLKDMRTGAQLLLSAQEAQARVRAAEMG
ncbi:MAG: histidine--tRNA ligase [Microscillaceae bacterium]|nr:histidine--tRNA ligase [Microscillaceae bacterium]